MLTTPEKDKDRYGKVNTSFRGWDETTYGFIPSSLGCMAGLSGDRGKHTATYYGYALVSNRKRFMPVVQEQFYEKTETSGPGK